MGTVEIPPIGEETALKVSERVIGHLSRGLYRSPASAIRELVSNAWDADATVVRINLNPPFFGQVMVTDNGRGFSAESFVQLMSGQIGNSEKRMSQETTPRGREVIGRLGIGMLGIGLVCHSFTIASRIAGGEAWKARVRFVPDMKDMLDHTPNENVSARNLKVGTFEFLDPVSVNPKHGTEIVADRLHPTFRDTFAETYGEEAAGLPLAWQDVQNYFSKKASLSDAGEYLRTVWEVAAAAPLPYWSIPDDAPEPLVLEQRRLQDADFAVLLDGRRLYKPIDFGAWPDSLFYAIPRKAISVYGTELEYSGYFLARNGKQIKPDALRGALLRVRGVGIGNYDSSFLDYPTNEGPRTRWVTAEVFVAKGIEEALNIDRDSFNRFDPNYRELAKTLHGLLQKTVMSDLNRRQEERNQRRQQAKVAEQEQEASKRRQEGQEPTDHMSNQHTNRDKKKQLSVMKRIVEAFQEWRTDPDGDKRFAEAIAAILGDTEE